MSEYDGFRVEHDGERGVATITLDVPGKFNRVSMLARDQLAGLFAELDRDDAVRFVVLTGAGGQFTAGGDIAGFLTKSPWVVSQLAKNVAAPGAVLEAGDREAARATSSASGSSSRSPATSGSPPTTCRWRCPRRRSG